MFFFFNNERNSETTEKASGERTNHNADLSNAEKAPDRRLFHEVGSDVRGEERAGQPEKNALDHHVAFHDKERRKHQERVNGSGWDPVGGRRHRYTTYTSG